ncbi:hypothetical protein E2562_021218 [Oryza meyeriana var. granulata]|uniref:Uncharacterized protein n=1 Tax=Oryza meyeriana var. granulata TaxID=110450 RepID=A0A6G1DYQ1_9ORYZ|nr:hypothetical protein E2562_021218 [Oryza meyeriana var. granulata]
MARQEMPLLVHGEVTDQHVNTFDREKEMQKKITKKSRCGGASAMRLQARRDEVAQASVVTIGGQQEIINYETVWI